MPRAPSRSVASRIDPILLLALAVGAMFLLTNLGDRQLWADEAETVGLARNILRFGVPRAYDGVNYISQWWQVAGREDFNEDLIWVLTPWLQLYLTAGAFALLAESPFTARLPFALFGIGSVWLTYRLALAVFGDRRVARLGAWLLVFCIPFLLHMRQGRYYALIVFFTTAVVLSYLRLLERRRGAAPALVLSAALLFHSSYGVWLPVLGGVAAHAALCARSRIRLRVALSILVGVAVLVAPFALYAQIHRTSSLLSTRYVAFNLLNHLITINHYVLPLAWVLAALALRIVARRWPPRSPLAALRWTGPGVSVIALIVGAGLAFAASNLNYFFRYAIQLVPLLVLLHAALLIEFCDRLGERLGRSVAGACLAVLVAAALFTSLAAQPVFPLLYALESRTPREPWADDPLLRRPRATYSAIVSEIFDFVHEITHNYRGPDGALAEFLNRHAQADDVVLAQYGDVPLIVATGLAVRGGSQGVPYLGEPDWIVPRAFESADALRRFAREHGYDEYVLDVADTRWENQPDPYSHQYRTVPAAGPAARGYPPLVVYGHPRTGGAGGGLSPGRAAGGPACDARHTGPPNLLLVSLDSARADRLTEARRYFTEPTRLQRLASKGTLFTLARTTAPGTAAATASLLTGLDPRGLAGAGPDRALPTGVPTLAQRLREAGYQTAAVLGSAALPAELGLAAGFDVWLGPPEGAARREDFEVARQARRWLLARAPDRAWFLWVHLNAAHGPYRASQNPFDSLSALSARVRAQGAGGLALPILADNTGHGGIPAYQALPGVRRPGAYRATHDLMTLVGDFFLGELLDTLEVCSASDRTIVAVAGSHGESLGENGVYFNHGEDLDESVLRVPLVLYVPGQVPAVVEDPVSIVDLAPTLLPLLGLPVPSGLSGLDLSVVTRGGAAGVGARAGVMSELRPPQGPGKKLAVSATHWRVEQDADGSRVAIDLLRPEAPRLDPTGARRDPELDALVAELVSASQRPGTAPGPSLAFPPGRRATLEWLGYVAGRLPGAPPDSPASGRSTR